MEEPKVIVIPKTVFPNVDPTTGILKKRRVAAYCRVSTDMDDQLHSLETQKIEFERKIKENPDWIYAGLYFDEGISGTLLDKREGFNTMIKDALNGKIDLILVKSISRYARNTVHSIQTKRDLEAKGVEIFFEKENISSLDPSCETMFTIYSSFAQEESRQISTNVTWGIRARMREGKYKIARAILGYKKNEKGEMDIDEEGRKTVECIFTMFMNGYTYREIAKHLINKGIKNSNGNVSWSVSTISELLSNEKYCGDILYQKTYCKSYLTHIRKQNNGEYEKFFFPNHHPAIISKPEFMYVQLLKKKRRDNYNPINNKNNLPLAGLVYCSCCGRQMRRVQYYKGKQYERFALTCKMQKRNNQNFVNCTTTSTLDYDLVLSLVEKIIKERNIDFNSSLLTDSILEGSNLITSVNKIAELKKEINETERELTSLITKQVKSGLPLETYQNKYNKLQAKLDKAKALIAEINEDSYFDYENSILNRELHGFLCKNTAISARIIAKDIKRIYRLEDDSLLIVLSKKIVSESQLESIRINACNYTSLQLKTFTNDNKTIYYRLLNLED